MAEREIDRRIFVGCSHGYVTLSFEQVGTTSMYSITADEARTASILLLEYAEKAETMKDEKLLIADGPIRVPPNIIGLLDRQKDRLNS